MFASLDGRTPEGSPEETLNVRVSTGSIVSRYGFENLASPPHATFEALGFDYLQGYDDSYVSQKEFLLCALVNATRKPYSVNPTTAARTEITNGASAVSLEDTEHFAFVFGGVAYIVAPSGTVTLYSHEIGNNASFATVQNTSYTPAPSDPELTITVGNPQDIALHDAGDTYTYTSNDTFPSGTVTDSFSAEGDLELSGPSNDASQFGGYFQVQQEFASAKDISGADYFYVTIEAGPYLRYFTQTTQLPEFKIGGVWVSVTDAKFFFTGSDVGERNFSNSPARTATWVIYARGMTLTAVQGVRFRFNCKPNRGGTSPSHFDFATVSPLRQGGYYLEQDGTGKRLWDSSLVGDGVTYGIRFTDGGSTVSSIKQRTITAEQAQGFDASTFSCPAGAIIRLESSAPVSPYDRTQFLRLDESVSPAEWKELGTVTSAPFYFQDQKIETEIPGLSTITTGTAPDPAPGFTTQGLKNGFAYKGWVIWLFKGGKTNVRHSEVGNPLSLRAEDGNYDPDDLTQPADYSLADDFADEPVGGVQAGQFAIILGQKAAYSQGGDAPIEMTPCRQIPGSMGCAGPRAFCRFRPGSGEYGVAYMDNAWNVWMVFGNATFQGDSAVKPVELSADCRGFFKRFLFDEQKGEFGLTDASRVRMYVDETDGSLWVRLGKRAMVYRPQDPVNGFQGWEPYEYAANNPPGESSVSACIGPSATSATISEVNRSGDLSWSLIGNALQSDDLRALAGPFDPGEDTQVLRVASLIPSPIVPPDAVLTSIEMRVEDSVSSAVEYALPIVSDKAQVRLSGSDYGSDQSGWTVSTTDTSRTIAITLGSITAASVNAGNLALDLGYKTPITADHNTSGNWSFSVSPSGTTNTTGAPGATVTNAKVVTATYIGPGSPPDHVWVSLASTTTVGPTYIGTPPTPAQNWSGTATADNGLDTTATGQIEAPTIDYPGSITASGSKIVKINLTAGTGTYTVNQQGSMSVSGTGFDAINVSGSVTPTFQAWAAQSVRVDSVLLKVCYTLTQSIAGQDFGIGWEYFAVTPQGKLWGVRTSGHIDSFERDGTGDPITGTNIDGGRTMPTGKFQFVLDSEPIRLNHLAVQFEGPTTLGVSAKSERTAFTSRTISGGRSVQFPTTIQGEKVTCRLDIPENFSARSLTAWVTPLSRQLRQR